jgi:hypothetical protein
MAAISGEAAWAKAGHRAHWAFAERFERELCNPDGAARHRRAHRRRLALLETHAAR